MYIFAEYYPGMFWFWQHWCRVVSTSSVWHVCSLISAAVNSVA